MTHDPQRNVNEVAWARRIEPPSLRTWPAAEVVPLAGWTLRFSKGYGHRPNSVAAFAFTGDDVERAIGEAEALYRRRNLTPMFQIAAAVEPADLARVLTRRGYRAITPSLVCVAQAETVRERCSSAGGGQLSFAANADFDGLVVAGSHSPEDGRERLEVLSRIAVPLVRVTILEGGIGVACGTGGAADGLVGINLMRTHPDYRRRGFGRQVLGAIAAWALAQGIATLYLSVEKANAPARALYDGAGFERAYDYSYYVRD
jgi:GNAT superfamily N-acetyltransferase